MATCVRSTASATMTRLAPSAAASTTRTVRCIPHHQSRRRLVVQAQQPSRDISSAVSTMLKRYDFLSTGMGALCVTGYFWARGQDPLVALEIAACSTVVALVANELFFTPEQK